MRSTAAAPPRPLITSPGTLVRDGNGQVTITGTAPAGATVRVTPDGNAAQAVDVPAPNGTFSATLTLSTGSHTIRAELPGKGGGFDEVTVTVVDPSRDVDPSRQR
jgi:hypothetical protein